MRLFNPQITDIIILVTVALQLESINYYLAAALFDRMPIQCQEGKAWKKRTDQLKTKVLALPLSAPSPELLNL